MKFKLAAAVLCAAGIAMPAFAGDAEDVKATIAKFQKAYNACDVDTAKSLVPDALSAPNEGARTQTGIHIFKAETSWPAST